MFVLSWQITLVSLVLLPALRAPGALRRQASCRRSPASATRCNGGDEHHDDRALQRVRRAAREAVRHAGQRAARRSRTRPARVRDIGVTSSDLHADLLRRRCSCSPRSRPRSSTAGAACSRSQGALDVGTVVALTAYLNRLYGPLTTLSNVQVDVMTALVSFDRVLRGARPRADDRRQARRGRRARGPGAHRVRPRRLQLPDAPTRCRSPRSSRSRCSTRRPNHQVLSDVSFTAEPGQLVALVGPSGAGKTTISDLVPRLYDVQSAARSASTASTCATPRSRRCATPIGVVTQDAHLFHDTIRANLRSRKPDATDAEMRDALRGRADPPARRRRCPTASTPSSATAATGSRAARSSASRSPACC